MKIGGCHIIQAHEIDDGVSVILSPEVATRLGVAKGGVLAGTWDDDGSLSLVPAETEFDRQMAVAGQVMRNDRAMLAALAKS